jgi:hypothetical protein
VALVIYEFSSYLAFPEKSNFDYLRGLGLNLFPFKLMEDEGPWATSISFCYQKGAEPFF